jgi:hypothetical protein
MSAPKEDAKTETIARENQLTRKSNKALNGRRQFTVECSTQIESKASGNHNMNGMTFFIGKSLMPRRVEFTGSEEKCWKRCEMSGKSQSPVIKKSAVNVMQ